MKKISIPMTNKFCPQQLYLHGTYEKNGRAHYGLYGWFGFCWDNDMHVMAAIGGSTKTREHIDAKKVFSANLVTEDLLSFADYCGMTDGTDPDKMLVEVDSMPGAVLDVPLLKRSPWSFELEVEKTIPMNDGGLYICKVHNVMVLDTLTNDDLTIEERMRLAAPVLCANQSYFFLNPKVQGTWGDFKDTIHRIAP